MRETYFHEDDYCQVEVLPATNYEFCRNQLGEIESFSAQHDTGFGWTDMYVRSDVPTTLRAIQLARTDLATEVTAYLPEFDRVLTGYSTHREECKSTTAFGANRNLVLYAEHDDGIVSKIWLTINGLSANDMVYAKRLFEYFSRFQLMLVDWSMSALVVLADSDAVVRYLAEFAAETLPEKNA